MRRQTHAYNQSMEDSAADLARSARTIDGNFEEILTAATKRLSGHAKAQATATLAQFDDLNTKAGPKAVALKQYYANVFGFDWTPPPPLGGGNSTANTGVRGTSDPSMHGSRWSRPDGWSGPGWHRPRLGTRKRRPHGAAVRWRGDHAPGVGAGDGRSSHRRDEPRRQARRVRGWWCLPPDQEAGDQRSARRTAGQPVHRDRLRRSDRDSGLRRRQRQDHPVLRHHRATSRAGLATARPRTATSPTGG